MINISFTYFLIFLVIGYSFDLVQGATVPKSIKKAQKTNEYNELDIEIVSKMIMMIFFNY